MERVEKVANKTFVGIAQKFKGWNVSTYSVNGTRVKYFADKDVRTYPQADKEFDRQKSEFNKQKNMQRYGMLRKPSVHHKPIGFFSAFFGLKK